MSARATRWRCRTAWRDETVLGRWSTPEACRYFLHPRRHTSLLIDPQTASSAPCWCQSNHAIAHLPTSVSRLDELTSSAAQTAPQCGRRANGPNYRVSAPAATKKESYLAALCNTCRSEGQKDPTPTCSFGMRNRAREPLPDQWWCERIFLGGNSAETAQNSHNCEWNFPKTRRRSECMETAVVRMFD